MKIRRILALATILAAITCLSLVFRGKVEAATKVLPTTLHLQTLSTCPNNALHCVALSVTPATSGAVATGVNFYKSTTSGGCSSVTANGCTKIGSTTLPANTLIDSPLPGATTFFYVATAFNATGESAASNQQSATTQPDPVPDAPTLNAPVAK